MKQNLRWVWWVPIFETILMSKKMLDNIYVSRYLGTCYLLKYVKVEDFEKSVLREFFQE